MQNSLDKAKNLARNQAPRLALVLLVLITAIYTVSVTEWPGRGFETGIRALSGTIKVETTEVPKVVAGIEESEGKSYQEVREKSDVHEEVAAARKSDVHEEVAPARKSDVHEEVAAARKSDVHEEVAPARKSDAHEEVAAARKSDVHEEVAAAKKSDVHEEVAAARKSYVHEEVAAAKKSDVHEEVAAARKSDVHEEVAAARKSDVYEEVAVARSDIHEAINAQIDRQILLNLSLEYVRKNNDFTIKPWQIKLLPEYKSYCWSEVEGVRCLPSFYLAGMMKCGTTDLWYHIIRHPQILEQYDNKEPLWWGQNRVRSDRSKLSDLDVQFTAETHKYYKITMEEYTNNFGSGKRVADPNLRMGDASGTTMWMNRPMRDFINQSEWSEQPSQLLRKALSEFRLQPAYLAYQFTPNAKFIIILRNPVERIYSQYLFSYYLHQRGNTKPAQSDFHDWILGSIGQYRKCLAEGKGVRFCSYDRISDAIPLGFYVIFITDLLRVVPKQNVLVLNFDVYTKDRGITLKKVFQFLGVAHDEKIMSSLKSGKVANSRKVQNTDIGPMWNKTQQILSDFYRPFNQELAMLLNDDKFLFV